MAWGRGLLRLLIFLSVLWLAGAVATFMGAMVVVNYRPLLEDYVVFAGIAVTPLAVLTFFIGIAWVVRGFRRPVGV
jgi:hypothetical protein